MTTHDAALPVLLSQAYVAWTIEFDNAWERRLRELGWGPRFLVSYVLWANFMRYVPEEGIGARDLADRCGPWNGPIKPARMSDWWGYVTVDGGVVRPSVAGTAARKAWHGLVEATDEAWLGRFGPERIEPLVALLRRCGSARGALPPTMPVLAYGDGYATPRPTTDDAANGDDHGGGIGAALARALLAFTLEVESRTELPAATAACVVRGLAGGPARLRDLPLPMGVVKEAITPALNWLSKRGHVEAEGAGAKAVFRLTPTGAASYEGAAAATAEVEADWRQRIGDAGLDDLRAALASLFDVSEGRPLIADGLAPPEGCWRGDKAYLPHTLARLEDPGRALPHHPLLTHRGGWPDGA